MGRVLSSLREHRLAQKLSQLELAQRAGISRQALCSIEAGSAVPGTDVALRLAQALGVRVESLFRLESGEPPLEAALAGSGEPLPESGDARVVLAEIDGRWVAHPLGGRHRESCVQPADGVVKHRRGQKRVKVEPLGSLEVARQRLVVMGCAPALGLLATRLSGDSSSASLAWIPGSSTAALEALRRGEVHIAGIHLLDEPSGQYNVPFVCREFPERPMLVFNLASWEQGIVVAPGNPLGIRRAADLLNPKVRFVARDEGSGASKLLERALRPLGAGPEAVAKRGETALGHMEVAQAVALDAADAGISIRSAAIAYGLGFVPLAEERFDIVLPREHGDDPRVERLVDLLGSRSFRRELDAVGGYATGESGQQIADTAGC
jgi:molybdate-binding protein/transcriptional regulator with XRE-family HTH domain